MPRPVSFSADVVDDDELRLLGDPAGKRLLELGVSQGMVAVAAAERGARAIAVDPGEDRIAAARSAADEAGVRVELHHGDIADLGFATSGSIDVAVIAGTLTLTDDVPRLLRQVHRVLRADCALVVAAPHPAAVMLDGAVVRRRYGSPPSRSIADVFTALHRAHFRLDSVHELFSLSAPDALAPAVLIVRARKQGS